MLLHLLLAAAIAAPAAAAPTITNHVLHETRPDSDWTPTSRVAPGAMLPIRIGLAQSNLGIAHEFLREVSDPASERYGQHWPAERVHNAFAPDARAVEAVRAWLESSGIAPHRVVQSDNKGWLAFDGTAKEAEDLFRAEYYEHEHPASDRIRVGCDRYHLPAHLVEHVDYVTPGAKLVPVKRVERTKRSRAPLRRSISAAPAGPHAAPVRRHERVAIHSRPNITAPGELANCGFNMTPTCIRAMYGIPRAPQDPHPTNALGLYEQGDYFAKTDIDLWYRAWAPEIPNGTYPTPALIDGANFSVPAYSSLNDGESDIDIEMAESLLYPQNVTLYQVDDQVYEPVEVNKANLFNTFLDAIDGSYCTYSADGETGDDPQVDPQYPDPAPGGYKGKLMCGVYQPTNVISASYGQAESDVPRRYAERQCNEFLKLGLQGHSVLFAVGDYGVASSAGDGGDVGSVNGCLGETGKVFNPQYPSNCPYVTSVGGSMLYNGQSANDSESVMHANLGGSATGFSSAGGFANYFGRPWYQELAVQHYFDTAKPKHPSYAGIGVDTNNTEGVYNRIGRGMPDVAANGAYFPSFHNGQPIHEFGSSLASPLFASVLTLVRPVLISSLFRFTNIIPS